MVRETIDSDNVEQLLDDVAGHLNAQHGRLIDVTVWLLANPIEWQGDGVWTAAQFLAWRCGVSPSTARSIVRAAERADELPESIELVRRGEMSLDQLTPIVGKVPAWGDAQLASLAPRLTVAQVQRVCRDTAWESPPVATDERSDPPAANEHVDGSGQASYAPDSVEPAELADDENRVTCGYGADGRWWLHADLDADLGEQVAASFANARDRLFRQLNHGDDQTSLIPVSDVDAFVALAQASVEVEIAERPERRDRFRVNLFIDPAGRLLTTEHVAVPDSIARLITCDGRIDPVFVDGAIPVAVGRAQRTIPDRLRRLVLFRDGHRCQVPGCTATRGLDLHHIVHWADEGPTDSWNLITICSRHHRMHHKHRLGISGNADEPDSLRFVNAHGVDIRRSGARPKPPSAPPPTIAGDYQHPIGERLDGRWLTFMAPDEMADRDQHRDEHRDEPPGEHPGLAG